MAETNEFEGGRYLILEPLGEGGSGSVFRTWDQKRGQMVALKRIKDNPGIFTSIRDEAGILATLDHPNIVKFLDFDGDEKGNFVVMELIYGWTLDEFVEEKPLGIPAFLALMNQICSGLAAAHALGLIHCDLKPGNIMLESRRDGSFTAKLLDFGLGTAIVSVKIPESMPSEGLVIQGSPLTMPPEQLKGHPMDARSDIYSLGCTFYYALGGAYPHQGEDFLSIAQGHLYNTPKPLHQVNPAIPVPVSEAIMKMLARDPDERPQDAESARLSIEAAARAPLASPIETAAPAIPNSSSNSAEAIASSPPPPPSIPGARILPSASLPPQQPKPTAPLRATPGGTPVARTQILICCSLAPILAAAAIFGLSNSKKAFVQQPVPDGPQDIMAMIQAAPSPTPTPGPSPKKPR